MYPRQVEIDAPPLNGPLFEAGPFDVLRRVGQGGMAEVWLGRHRVHHTEAAIKVVRGTAGDPHLTGRLRAEIRAMAGLDHPRVATVLDTGTLDAHAETDSDGRVKAGSPWLAIAWVPHGDLARIEGHQPWTVTRSLLLDVLEALAHAHARGVVHRDLKPGNVLLRIEDGGVRAVLTDFGIAQVFDPHGDEPTLDQRVAGTPEYMAPEQIRGFWRDVGPWTDLYALGCLGWRLATGDPPFIGEHPMHITLKQLDEAPPPLVLREGYPPAFADWLRRLLAKDPYGRFERAADAAAALRACDPDERPGTGPLLEALTEGPRPARPGAETASPSHVALVLGATADDDLVDAETWQVAGFETRPGSHPGIELLGGVIEPDDGSAAGALSSIPRGQSGPITLPDDWRNSISSRGVVGRAGPGLFGLRPLPPVGDIAARDRLWAALRTAWQTRRPQLCVVESSTGNGRRGLSDWLTQRADELGAAGILRATHGPIPARRDGIGAAIRGWFRAHGCAHAELARRIDAELRRRAPGIGDLRREETRAGLIEVIEHSALSEGPGRRDRQFEALLRWLRWSSRRRPLIVRLDDAHWSASALSLALQLARAEDLPLMILVVIAGPTERAHVGAEREAMITQLDGADRVEHIRLGPLPDRDMQTLLVDGVGLSPTLAARLARQAAGNRRFAMHVVAEWLADGALRPGRLGMVPVGGALPSIPGDRIELGQARVARVIATSGVEPAMGWRAMEAAAMLGEAVATDDWASVTGAPLETLNALIVALLDAGLARPGDEGWSFAEGFAREALVARVREGGRARKLGLLCALAVLDVDPDDPRPAERRARYLLDGGHRLEAVEAYTDAARRATDRGGYRAAAALLDTADGVFAAAGLLGTDVRRSKLLAIRAEVARFTGQPDLAAAALATLRRMPQPPQRPWARAELSRLDGQHAFFDGQTDAALSAYGRAEDLFQLAGDPDGVARSLHGQGWALCSLGEVIAGHAHFERGRRVADGAGLELQVAWCLHGVAVTRIWGGRAGGLALIDDAIARFERLDQPIGSSLAAVHRADALQAEGRADEARSALDRAVGTLRRAEAHLLADALTRRAALALDMGQYAAARSDATEVEQCHIETLGAGLRCVPALVLAALELHAGNGESGRALFDRAMQRAGAALFATPYTGALLEGLADRFTDDPPRAVVALTFAQRIWRPLAPRRGAAITRRLRALRGATGG